MPWSDWIDFDTLKTISWHTSGVVGGILSFIVIGYIIDWGIGAGPVKGVLESIEGFALVGLVLWLVYQTGHLLWIRRVKNGSRLCVLVA